MTGNQMKYLLCLIRQEQKKNISEVARIFGVNKSTVSRAISNGIQEGILDEEFSLTPYGKSYVSDYKKRFDCLRYMLQCNGVGEETAKEDAYAILEVCSNETIQFFQVKGVWTKVYQELRSDNKRKIILNGEEICQYIEEGTYKIQYVFYKDRKMGIDQISMANEAFFHPAVLILRKNRGHVCLKLKTIRKTSPRSRIQIQGKMRTMKYEYEHQIKKVTIDDEIAYIPLEAIRFVYIPEDNILRGMIRLIMTCTAGSIHMPESAANLILFLQ
ncbi:hypothetical protein [Velocimicrobium porci]|uniref:NEAT domain-containing protein n=1 Tax=Velocimicrobium porci TaxID=2606634 RepID=A0A6L5XXG5_9FIRM|nr:hypothetical protein [Velocimicrobium porci]MSS63556.1 hypothetical protein [Velocimicrobium porci]